MGFRREKRTKEKAEQEWTELWNTYSAKIKRFLIRTIGDEHDAKDLTQKTFIALYTALLIKPIDNPWSWLLRTAGNHLLHYRREKARQKNHEVSLEDNLREVFRLHAPPPSTSRADFISGLPDWIGSQDKKLLALYFYDQFDLREIAAQGGYTYGGFRVHLSRLLSKLRHSGPDVFSEE